MSSYFDEMKLNLFGDKLLCLREASLRRAPSTALTVDNIDKPSHIMFIISDSSVIIGKDFNLPKINLLLIFHVCINL